MGLDESLEDTIHRVFGGVFGCPRFDVVDLRQGCLVAAEWVQGEEASDEEIVRMAKQEYVRAPGLNRNDINEWDSSSSEQMGGC
jgi:hypothetical protein